ncbi:MAG: hypothetical protein LBC26_01330 [Oscillospiraceae bacterium]|jgi:hypothetical protein|nr:hypothetical protein [Oscillospiraceae bacterium]
MTFAESGMFFDFSGLLTAELIDLPENKFDGASVVDFVAESEDALLFVEAKNYVNASDDPTIQAAIDKAQAASFADIDDEVLFARRMIKKLEHSLFVQLATGRLIRKPAVMVLLFNLPTTFRFPQRVKLLNRLKRYIPENAKGRTSIFFDMPTLSEAQERYGFTATVRL